MGDVVHGLQIAQSIKSQMPLATIDWVIKDRFLPLVQAFPSIRQAYTFQRGKGLFAFKKLLKTIRTEKYDYVLDFQGLARTAIMTFFAKGSCKIGREDAREGARFFYHKRVPLPSLAKQSHALDILLEFLPLLNLKKELTWPLPLQLPKQLPPLSSRVTSPPILILPSSRQRAKEWHGFEKLAHLILKTYPQQAIVWDSHIGLPLSSLENNRLFVNTSGKTSLEELMFLVANARLIIANDSGPMHLAAALGKPVLGIFGPTLPRRFAPYPLNKKQNLYIQAPKNDLKLLKAEAVFEVVQKMLLAV